MSGVFDALSRALLFSRDDVGFQGESKKLARGLAIGSDCDGARAVSGARRIRGANPPTANNQMASLSSLEARKATFLLALI
jgi:hypothetical protein